MSSDHIMMLCHIHVLAEEMKRSLEQSQQQLETQRTQYEQSHTTYQQQIKTLQTRVHELEENKQMDKNVQVSACQQSCYAMSCHLM